VAGNFKTGAIIRASFKITVQLKESCNECCFIVVTVYQEPEKRVVIGVVLEISREKSYCCIGYIQSRALAYVVLCISKGLDTSKTTARTTDHLGSGYK
jgi:hypothetical protein